MHQQVKDGAVYSAAGSGKDKAGLFSQARNYYYPKLKNLAIKEASQRITKWHYLDIRGAMVN